MKKVRVLSLEEDDFKPSIVTFPQNHPSKRFLVEGEDSGDDGGDDLIDFDLYQYKHIKNKAIVHGHNNKFDWLGSNGGRTQMKVQASKYLLGFYSEQSKHITVVEAENIFNLKQHFKDEKAGDGDDETHKRLPNMRAIEQKKLLVEEFGNTRSKKMMDAYKTSIVTENKISEASEMRDLFREKAQEFKRDKEDKKEDPKASFILSKRETLPEFNLEATEPERIYSFFSIIPREEWEDINTKEYNGIIHSKENLSEKSKKNNMKFILQELEEIKHGRGKFKDPQGLGSKLKCLVYLNWLLKFLQIKVLHKSLDQVCEEMRMSQNTLKSILSRFFIATHKEQEDKIVYTRNTMLTDKLICYILILGVTYGDYEFEATHLVADMKIEPKKFTRYLEEVGCSMKKRKIDEEDKLFMKLKAPLEMRVPTNKRPKRG